MSVGFWIAGASVYLALGVIVGAVIVRAIRETDLEPLRLGAMIALWPVTLLLAVLVFTATGLAELAKAIAGTDQ